MATAPLTDSSLQIDDSMYQNDDGAGPSSQIDEGADSSFQTDKGADCCPLFVSNRRACGG